MKLFISITTAALIFAGPGVQTETAEDLAFGIGVLIGINSECFEHVTFDPDFQVILDVYYANPDATLIPMNDAELEAEYAGEQWVSNFFIEVLEIASADIGYDKAIELACKTFAETKPGMSAKRWPVLYA